MATILTKEVKDVHLEHSSGHTPAQLKAFSQLFVKKSLARKGPICGAPEYRSAYFEIGRLVPELGGLRYLVKYPSPPNSGTNLENFENWQIGTRA